MLDSITVPRRSYDFEDYIDILRRNFVWLIAPAFLGLIIATVIAFSLEDTYVSGALIRVTPQQISDKVVGTISTQDVADRINSMAQKIMSRQVLAGIITSDGLFKKDVAKMPMEDVVEKMRTKIGISMREGVAVGGRVLPAMAVSFAYTDKYTAQKVCQDLVSRFMDLSATTMAEGRQETDSFINDELTQAKADLDGAEQKVVEFRNKNAGHLPEEMSMNMQQVNALNGQLGNLSQLMNQNGERRMILEASLAQAKAHLSAVKPPEVVAHNDKVNSLNAQIEARELEILRLKDRYTDDHPDLVAAREQLAFLNKQRDLALKAKPSVSESRYDPTTATADRMNAEDNISNINTQLSALALEASQYRKQIAGVSAAIKTYEGRLVGLPSNQKEYDDLNRQVELARQKYLNLQGTHEVAVFSGKTEDRKLGQNLEVIDPASLPTSPAAPKRTSMLPLGLVAGLGLGIVIVAIREVKDTSLKSLKDARLYTQLDILGSVPLLENDVVVQRRKQMMWVGWATATIAGLLIMAGSVARYYLAKG